jgi:two-component system sensor histidine kinase MtrB
LTTILGLTEVIANPKRALDPEQFQESMKLLRRQGERIGALLTNLLDYSRIEAGGTHVELEDIDLSVAVKDALSAAPAPENISVEVSVDDDLTVTADPVRFEQVLVNLLTNSYRYGGEHVKIVAEGGAGEVVLVVSDDGPGIEPTLLPHLFEPFTRGSETQSITGSGLGLAIVRRLLETFGAAITVKNVEPHGACFAITLMRPHVDR